MARTTLVAIEKGQRAVRPDELLAFASLYGMSVGKLTSPDAIHVDLAAKFRTGRRQGPVARGRAVPVAPEPTCDRRRPTGAAVGQELRTDYPPPVRIDASRAVQQAEDAADALRARLGLGLGPIPDLIGTLETELGLRIFFRPLPSQVSGLYACDPRSAPAC